jgi:hypothetical protein
MCPLTKPLRVGFYAAVTEQFCSLLSHPETVYIMFLVKTGSTYDHGSVKTGHPVRNSPLSSSFLVTESQRCEIWVWSSPSIEFCSMFEASKSPILTLVLKYRIPACCRSFAGSPISGPYIGTSQVQDLARTSKIRTTFVKLSSSQDKCDTAHEGQDTKAWYRAPILC